MIFALLKLLDDLESVASHEFDAGRVAAAACELLLHHQQLQNVCQVVIKILLPDVMGHDEVKEVFSDSLLEERWWHVGVVSVGEVGLGGRCCDFVEMLKRGLEGGPNFDGHSEKTQEVPIELHLALHC